MASRPYRGMGRGRGGGFRPPMMVRPGGYAMSSSFTAASSSKSGWFCLFIGQMGFDAQITEFCTKLSEGGRAWGYDMQAPSAIEQAQNLEGALEAVARCSRNPQTSNCIACVVVSQNYSEQDARTRLVRSPFGQNFRYFTLDLDKMNRCLYDPATLTSTLSHLCNVCKFPRIQAPQGMAQAAAGGSSNVAIPKLSASDWIFISIGSAEYDKDMLSDFCIEFVHRMRSDGLDLNDALVQKHVDTIDEAVAQVQALLQNPKTNSAASCMVVAPGDLSQVRSSFIRSFGRQLRFCTFGQNEIRKSLFNDAVDSLATRFAKFCEVPRKQSAGQSDTPISQMITEERAEQKPKTLPMGVSKVSDLCDRLDSGELLSSSSELIQKLTIDGSFYERIKQCPSPRTPPEMLDQIFKLVAAAGKFNASQFKGKVNELLQVLISTPDIFRYARDKRVIPLETLPLQRMPERMVATLRTAVKDQLFVLWLILDRFPSSHSEISGAVGSVLLILKQDDVRKSALFDSELEDLISRVELAGKAARSIVQQPEPLPKKPKDDQVEEPPNDFRKISVCPTKEDIVDCVKPFLRSNITQGAFESTEHYLDIQFRLLREDFVGPLRDGIRQFLSGQTKRTGLFVYPNSRILTPKVNKRNGTMMYFVNFSVMRYARWIKRLKYGSLVCLSSDNFQENLLFATVIERSPESLMKGQVWLNFDATDFDQTPLIDHQKTYVMVESAVYYQAYCHILKGLQAIPLNESVPFEKYFVSCSATVSQPTYLAHTPPVDFGSLFPPEADKRMIVTNIFDKNQWPSKEDLGLDQSQYEALQQALTSELAIIQGPPGTGKTFIGHQITKFLLSNERLWNPEHQHPILVVCYTNHALDQFLEGIVDFVEDDDDVVRVGGQCKNENLLKHCLHVIRQKKENLVENDLNYRLCAKRKERYDMENKITRYSSLLMKLSAGHLPNLLRLESAISESSPVLKRKIFNNKELLSEKDNSMLCRWLVTPPTYQFDNEQGQGHWKMNVPFVRALVEAGWPEIPVKRALHMTGNRNIDAAYMFLLQHQNNPDLLWQNDPVTAGWPMLTHIDSIVARGFPEEDAVIALENCNDVLRAVALLTKAFGSQTRQNSATTPQVDNNEAQADNNEELNAEIVGNEEDFRQLEEEFYTFHEQRNPKFSEALREAVDRNFFPSTYFEQYENGEQLARLERLRPMICNEQPMPEEEVENVDRPWKVPLNVRWQIYDCWVEKMMQTLLEQMKDAEKKYGELSMEMQELTSMSDRTILSSVKVIGMTTTGAALNQSLLRSIQPRIVIMEEAAEVLESHLVTSLSAGCEHVILIGDHKQLRPSLSVYELAKQYKLDISLFERLINNDFKHSMLKMQHRMRPEISRNLMPYFYPGLLDHESVLAYDDVRGMGKNMVFLNHNFPEAEEIDSKSHLNQYEAQMAAGLASHLLKQDYKTSQITILCAYLDQMIAIKRILAPMPTMTGIRVTVVDNYQGEESDIIILSLVRSNSDGKIGFLKVKNRVCVALSRAKIGFYCLGNFDHMVKCSRRSEEDDAMPWPQLIQKLCSGGYLHNTLPIICFMHGHEQSISKFSEFQNLSPEGGCLEPCNTRLDKCGHTCDKPCHAYDPQHEKMLCTKECARYCADGKHPCKKLCSAVCGNCIEVVEKSLPCGHKQQVKCFIPAEDAQCNEPCASLLPCGHPCVYKCSEPCTSHCKTEVQKLLSCQHSVMAKCWLPVSEIKCNQSVVKTWSICQHQVTVECHIDPETTPCPKPCLQPLPDCGHLCKGTCGQCRHGRLHVSCDEDCKRILICGHECKNKCSRVCPPCERQCETECIHSKCRSHNPKHTESKTGRVCGNICPQCTEHCGWACAHRRCFLRCWEPCIREPCTEHCPGLLACGHPCIGVCGELCPSICRFCNPEQMTEITEIFFGTEDEPDALFIQLIDCGHVLEMTGIDGWIRSQTESKDSDDGSNTSQALEVLSCPRCKAPIRKSMRFGKYLKQRMLDIEKVKIKLMGSTGDRLQEKRLELTRRISRFTDEIKISNNDEDEEETLRRWWRLQFGFAPIRRTAPGGPTSYKDELVKSKYKPIIDELRTMVEKPQKKDLTHEKLCTWENIMQFLMHLATFELNDLVRFQISLAERSTHTKTDNGSLQALCDDFFDCGLAGFLVQEHASLLDWIKRHLTDASETMLGQFSCEFQRLTLLFQISGAIFSALEAGPACKLKPEDYARMRDVLTQLHGTEPIEEKVEKRCQSVIDDWKRTIDMVPGTGITRTERAQITKAMGLNSGHWYKCPKGHIYAIGDCGGANQAGKCPECGSAIGGAAYHQIHADNERADQIMVERSFY